ncbi:MAG: response regulator [Deltaproteobacteria bacterium]|nr:response regulator [Deltaproteobacteria bacterium]
MKDNERYKQLFDNMSEGVAIYEAVDDGEDFVFVDYNKAGQSMDGTALDDAIGKRVTNVYPGVKKLGLFEVLQRVWKTGEAERHPVSLYEDDKLTFFRANYVYKLPSGEIVAVYNDETKRKMAEQENEKLLLISGERLKELQGLYSLSNAAAECTNTKDLFQRSCSLVPPAWLHPEIARCRLLFDEQELLSEPFEPTQWMQAAEIQVEGKTRGALEVYYLKNTPEQDEGPFLAEERKLIDGLARILGQAVARIELGERVLHLSAVLRAVRNVNQLITKEKDREKLLRGACENLTATRGYFNSWIALFDDEQKATATYESGLGADFDPMAKRLKRGELSRCVRMAIKQEAVVLIDDPPTECGDCPLTGLYAGRVGLSSRLEHEGRVFGILSVSLPQGFSKDEEEISLLKEVADDIAFALHLFEVKEEQKLLENQLLQSQKMESVGRLAGGVAHDFNNLLTVILSSCTFMAEDLRDGDPLLDDLQQIKSAGDRAVALTSQLLAFSRQQMLQPEAIDLNRTMENLDRLLRRLIGEDIDIATRMDPELWKVMADPGQIEQIVMNLAVNARDAMPTGGKLTIETANIELDEEYARRHAGVTPGPHVMLAASDTGSGMDAETAAQIFDPFFTTKEKGKGTGLGLSTVYGIVKQHGGNIWIYTEPGKGAIFKIYLPRAKTTEEKAIRPQNKVTDSRGTETVLVVEDAAAVLRLAVKVLKRKGYNVLQARDGLEGESVANAHEGPIDLLLTDVVMPNSSGKELAGKLLAKRPNIKVLYMSGYTDNAIVHHGVLDPGTHFVQKPFSVDSLAQKVREVLNLDQSKTAANSGDQRNKAPTSS